MEVPSEGWGMWGGPYPLAVGGGGKYVHTQIRTGGWGISTPTDGPKAVSGVHNDVFPIPAEL